MRFTRPRDQHETPRTSADRTRPDRVRTDLTCDTGGCHGTGACLHTGTCHHTGGCHQTSADDPSLPIAHRDVPCRSVLSRRSVLGAGVGAGALALTGCAGVPTEGPVERVNSPGPAAGQDPHRRQSASPRARSQPRTHRGRIPAGHVELHRRLPQRPGIPHRRGRPALGPVRRRTHLRLRVPQTHRRRRPGRAARTPHRHPRRQRPP